MFSVVIPGYNRQETIGRAIESVVDQNFNEEYEIVLVDDCSTDLTPSIMLNYKNQYPELVTVIEREQRGERVASRNDGMAAARGDWICWLDSDDEYMINYLRVCQDAINKWPEYKIFNFGSVIHLHRNQEEWLTKIGDPFHMEPHENFRSGKIGTGRFIFHKSVFDEVPMLIPSLRPYGDPGCFPELNRNPNYPMRGDGQWVPFGNPWGEDYHWYWSITRKFEHKTLDMLLYIEHRRP